jgi:hypothetical protein
MVELFFIKRYDHWAKLGEVYGKDDYHGPFFVYIKSRIKHQPYFFGGFALQTLCGF